MSATDANAEAESHPGRRLAITLLKMVCGVGLLGFLLWQAHQAEAMDDLLSRPKNWSLLVAAFGLTIITVLTSFVRWFFIARAADINLSLVEAIRVGALGFALNFVGPGAVSGDVFKAMIVARGRPGRRAAAVTTVAIDRIMGLISMLMVASGAILVMQAAGVAMGEEVRIACQTTLLITAVAMVGVGLLFVPGVAGEWLATLLRRAPFVGGLLGQLVESWRVYQRHKTLLGIAFLLCLVIDLLFVSSFYCIAQGLPLDSPLFVEHLFIVPMELIAAAIPVTPGGVGTREVVVDLLYQGFGVKEGQGTLIALAHSLTMLATGGLAIVYYLTRRAQAQSGMAEAEVAA